MALPEHLHPQTYWEERASIAEDAVQQLAKIIAQNMPPHISDALWLWATEWNRLLADLREKHPPLPPPPGEKS